MRILDDAAEDAGLDLITIGPLDVDVPGSLPGYRSPDLVTVPGKLAEGPSTGWSASISRSRASSSSSSPRENIASVTTCGWVRR